MDKLVGMDVSRGVRQGDPAAPFFFCLALDKALRLAAEKTKAEIFAFLDDVTIVGDGTEVDKAIKIIREEMAKQGLQYNVEQDSRLQRDLRILGAAVCKRESETNSFFERISPLSVYEDFTKLIEDIDEAPRLRLLRVCGVSKAGYAARCHGKEILDWLTHFDSTTIKSLTGLAQCPESYIVKNPRVYMPSDLGGLGVTLWSQVAEICQFASIASIAQHRLLKHHFLAEGQKRDIRPSQRLNRQWVEGLVDVQPGAYPGMLKAALWIPAVPRKIKDATINCPGCNAVFKADALVNHAPQCAKWNAEGNCTFRHNLAADRLAHALRERGVTTQREAPIGPNTWKDKPLRMDLVFNREWVDITVTNDELSRFNDKQRKYAAHAKAVGAKLSVIAFSPLGVIRKESVRTAKRIAKEAGTDVATLFGSTCAAIAEQTARARQKAANHVTSLWRLNLLENYTSPMINTTSSSTDLPADIPITAEVEEELVDFVPAEVLDSDGETEGDDAEAAAPAEAIAA